MWHHQSHSNSQSCDLHQDQRLSDVIKQKYQYWEQLRFSFNNRPKQSLPTISINKIDWSTRLIDMGLYGGALVPPLKHIRWPVKNPNTWSSGLNVKQHMRTSCWPLTSNTGAQITFTCPKNTFTAPHTGNRKCVLVPLSPGCCCWRRSCCSWWFCCRRSEGSSARLRSAGLWFQTGFSPDPWPSTTVCTAQWHHRWHHQDTDITGASENPQMTPAVCDPSDHGNGLMTRLAHHLLLSVRL